MPDTTAGARGLTTEEAARRLSEYGPNEPVVRQRLSALSQLLHLFANPLVIILLVALTVTTLGVVALGAMLPATPLGPLLAFTVRPVSFLIFVLTATTTSLGFVEPAKRLLIRYRGVSA